MKKKLIFLGILIFTGYVLMFPQYAVASAADGLVLWYEQVLPSLLPFAIVSNILIYSNYLGYITRYLYPVTRHLLPTSENGAFVLISGFLFGFPMGSRNCAQLLKCGKITHDEAEVLFIITNNISPVFISSYILCGQLKMPSLILPSYLVLFLPPLAAGRILLKVRAKTAAAAYNKPASQSQINFKIIDAGIMNGFETLTRLGGYIMLFSMIASMLQLLPLPESITIQAVGITEITNGIHRLSAANLSALSRYVLAMAFTAFGGLSGIAQTSSMIKGTGLSMKRYCGLKLLLTAVSAALTYPVYLLFC